MRFVLSLVCFGGNASVVSFLCVLQTFQGNERFLLHLLHSCVCVCVYVCVCVCVCLFVCVRTPS